MRAARTRRGNHGRGLGNHGRCVWQIFIMDGCDAARGGRNDLHHGCGRGARRDRHSVHDARGSGCAEAKTKRLVQRRTAAALQKIAVRIAQRDGQRQYEQAVCSAKAAPTNYRAVCGGEQVLREGIPIRQALKNAAANAMLTAGAMSHPSCSSRQNSRRRPPSDAQGARPGPQRQNATWPWMRMGRMLKPAKQARAIVATAVRILRTLALTHLQGHPLRRLLPCPIAGLPVRSEAEPIRRRMLRPVQIRAQRCGKRAACPPVATVACSPPSGICWLKSADVAKDGTGTAATNSNSDPTSRFEPFLMKPCPHIPFYASPARRHPAAPAASPRASLRGRSSVLRSLLFGCIISPRRLPPIKPRLKALSTKKGRPTRHPAARDEKHTTASVSP